MSAFDSLLARYSFISIDFWTTFSYSLRTTSVLAYTTWRKPDTNQYITVWIASSSTNYLPRKQFYGAQAWPVYAHFLTPVTPWAPDSWIAYRWSKTVTSKMSKERWCRSMKWARRAKGGNTKLSVWTEWAKRMRETMSRLKYSQTYCTPLSTNKPRGHRTTYGRYLWTPLPSHVYRTFFCCSDVLLPKW